MNRSENVIGVDPSALVRPRLQFVRLTGFFSFWALWLMSVQPPPDSALTVTVAPPPGSVFVVPELSK